MKQAAKKVPAKKAAPVNAKEKVVPAKKSELTQQQRRFVAEYLKDENGTQAAIRAGYSAHTAQPQASRLLCNVMVKTAIEQWQAELIAKVQKDTGITLERTLREIAKGAFHDPRKFFDDAGNLKGITELDDDTAAALAGFDVSEERGSGEERGQVVGFTKKIKLADRKGYLDMLMKHLGGYKKDNEQGGEAAANAIGALLGSMKRSALPVVANPED
jgi:phage terminase small subunit